MAARVLLSLGMTMNPARPPRTCRLVPCLAVCAWMLGLPRPAPAQTVWELTPYRVQALLAFQTAPELTPALQDDLVSGLAARIDALVARPGMPRWRPRPASCVPR